MSMNNTSSSHTQKSVPRCSRHLPTCSLYFSNWANSVQRVRALPLSHRLVQGMAAVAIIKDKPRFAGALLLGFVALLRACELVSLTPRQCSFLGSNRTLIISLPESKGAKRHGQTEQVIIYDTAIISFIHSLAQNRDGFQTIFGYTYLDFAADLKSLASFFGLRHPNLTAHGLRRGGATWFFQTTLSYDATQEHGRWELLKTARGYINQATADAAEFGLPSWGQHRLKRACAALPHLLSS